MGGSNSKKKEKTEKPAQTAAAKSKKNSKKGADEVAAAPPKPARFRGRIHILGAKGSGRRTFAATLTGTNPAHWQPTRDSPGLRQAVYHNTYLGDPCEWDVWVDSDYTAGPPEEAYWADVDIIFLVYAIDKSDTFDQVKPWINLAKNKANRPNVTVRLIGTRLDQEQYREVEARKASAIAAGYNVEYWETASNAANLDKIKEYVDKITNELVKIKEHLKSVGVERG